MKNGKTEFILTRDQLRELVVSAIIAKTIEPKVYIERAKNNPEHIEYLDNIIDRILKVLEND